MAGNKITVYSAVTDDKDTLKDNLLTFTAYNKFVKPVMNAKIYKVLPHLFLDTEYSIWVDGNLHLRKSPEKLVELLGDKDIAVFPHSSRENVFDEIEYCVQYNIGSDFKALREAQMRYKDRQPLSKLAACFLIVRRHTEEMNSLCEKWWAEICRGSARDQVSFPFVFPEDKIQWLPYQSNFKSNDYFTRTGHNK